MSDASEMVKRAARAGDREDAAMRGEPSIWSEAHFPPNEEGMEELRLERYSVYRCALVAALNPEDGAMVQKVRDLVRATGLLFTFTDIRAVVTALATVAQEQ